MKVVVINGQSVYDVVVEYYGSLEFLSQFLADNPGLTATGTVASGTIVTLDDSSLDQAIGINVNNSDWYEGESTSSSQPFAYVEPQPRRTNKTYVEPGQSVYDLTEQLYGDMNLLNKLLADNGWSYDTFLVAGQEVVVDESLRRKDYVYARQTKTVYNNSDFWPAEFFGPAGDFIIDHQDNIIDTHDEEKLIHDNG